MTEITVQVFDDVKRIKNILLKQNFKLTQSYVKTDVYYSKVDKAKLLKLSYNEVIANSLIVSQVVKNKKTTSFVCHKEKTCDKAGNVLSEQKTSTNVESFSKLLSILDEAGLNRWCELKVRSSIYQKGEIAINLQAAEGLGLFIELEEYPSISGLDDDEKFDLLVKEVNNLGLKLGDDYSCKKVFMKFKAKQN